MISLELARALRTAGLRWKPESGDRFTLLEAEAAGEVFTVSDMTVEAHVFPSGTVLGFNGTTEWALDSVALEDAVWLPREDQLRRLLGGTFRALRTEGADEETPRFEVDAVFRGEPRTFTAATAADAYGEAALALVLAAEV
jgi:hypothetical protein